MKCIAIDDEPLALKIISRYCEQVPSLHLLGAYTDPLEGISYIRSLQPDLLFLDICMPDFSGLDLVEALSDEILIIFTTAYRKYAVEGFELNVVDYLLKPFDFNRFMTAYGKAETRFQMLSEKTAPKQFNTDEILSFKCNYQNIQLPFDDILYIEGFDNYVRIFSSDKTYMPAITLKNMLNLLPEQRFIRVHKSFIVNVSKIKSFNRSAVITNKIQIPVGRSFCKDFLDKMSVLKMNV